MNLKPLFFSLLLLVYGSPASSQNKLLTIQDAVLKGKTSLAPKKLLNLAFLPGSDKYSYVDNQTLFVFEPGRSSPVFSLSLGALNRLLVAQNTDTLPGFDSQSWVSESSFAVKNTRAEWIYDLGKKSLTISTRPQTESGLKNLEVFKSGETYAYVQDNNVFVFAGGKKVQVTKDGSYEIENGKSVHRDEFGIHKGLFWSPEGNALAYYRMDQSDVTDYPIIDWTTYPAQNHNIKYPMAGSRSHYVTLHVYNLQKGTTIPIKTEGPKDQYLTNVAWSPDESRVYIAILNREQNHCWLNEYDANNGNFIKTLFEESDARYVEPQNPVIFVKYKPSQFIWQSRRDGYNHLYLYNTEGKLLKQLTTGKWEVKSIVGFDARGERLFFHANAESPVDQDFYAVDLKSCKIERLSSTNGFHTAILSDKGSFFIDNFTACYTPREYRICSTHSPLHVTFFKAENPIKDYQTGSWSLFSIKNAEGTELYCRMYKPVRFDSTKKYPVIVYLYNGPHSQYVLNTWMAGGELWYQYMAQKGYVIFTIEGRGTSNRGKEFEQVIHRNLGAREMEDQLRGLEYLKAQPFVDGSRVGIFGWSFGGFMSTTLMTRSPGSYKVGVAGGPVIDWSYYEIMYGERYMDTPQENKEGYNGNNLLNYVGNLKGKLLLIHGAQDNVVVWQHSIMYLKKAVEKGVQIDYFVYPGHEHNVLGKERAHLMDKICNYFIENL
ncbi:MAG TPA: DPP IV N-terminal domain-containing protein [Bacteroidia bacterium]|nr:DPP IV N-terminal domain-containing protein [Bacteroidia bacterium]